MFCLDKKIQKYFSNDVIVYQNNDKNNIKIILNKQNKDNSSTQHIRYTITKTVSKNIVAIIRMIKPFNYTYHNPNNLMSYQQNLLFVIEPTKEQNTEKIYLMLSYKKSILVYEKHEKVIIITDTIIRISCIQLEIILQYTTSVNMIEKKSSRYRSVGYT